MSIFLKITINITLVIFALHNSNLNNFNEKNVLNDHWKSKQKILKKYSYFYRISNKLLTQLTYNLNSIHNRTENKDYWRIIIFPWICSYVITLYDRWEILSNLKKKREIFLFLHMNMMAKTKNIKFQIFINGLLILKVKNLII